MSAILGQLGRLGTLGGGGSGLRSPISIFDSGAKGLWIDMSDRSTLFRDAAGTLPATAIGQSMGLILDKSRRLVMGPELVANGDFSGGMSGWTPFGTGTVGTVIAGGLHVITTSSNGDYGMRTVITGMTAGEMYKVSTVLSVVSPAVALQTASLRWANGDVTSSFINLLPTTQTTPLSLVGYIVPSGSTITILLVNGGLSTTGGGPYTTKYDNVSVRKISGSHLIQASAPYAPVVTGTSAGNWYARMDGLDDVMEATFPASLGSNCTVVRGRANSSPLVSTAQTIGTSYSVSSSLTGLLIADRALTAGETAMVTAYMQARS